MNVVTMESISFELARQLSMHYSRRNEHRSPLYSSRSGYSTMKYEELKAENLLEIDNEMHIEECIENIEVVTGQPLPSPEILHPLDPAAQVDSTSCWSTVCCMYKCWTNPQPAPEPDFEVAVVPVTDEMIKKKEACVQTWLEMIGCDTKDTTPPVEAPPEAVEEEKEEPKPEKPELISRRGDIPVVICSGKRPFLRGTHQYYRSSWRLKPSVIGAPETLVPIE